MNDGGLILVLVPVLCVFVSTAVVLLYRGHESRLVGLETWMRNTIDARLRELELAVTTANAATATIVDFRVETRATFAQMRLETKETSSAINALTLQVAGLTSTILHREPSL